MNDRSGVIAGGNRIVLFANDSEAKRLTGIALRRKGVCDPETVARAVAGARSPPRARHSPS